MPISTILSSDMDSGAWRISEFEHEVATARGEMLDLKANYGFDQLQLTADNLSIRMSTSADSSVVHLVWTEVNSLETVTTGGFMPAEDGRVGMIGLRLLSSQPGPLVFEVELDWLRLAITARTFEVRVE